VSLVQRATSATMRCRFLLKEAVNQRLDPPSSFGETAPRVWEDCNSPRKYRFPNAQLYLPNRESIFYWSTGLESL
jgi:hypothetical protein